MKIYGYGLGRKSWRLFRGQHDRGTGNSRMSRLKYPFVLHYVHHNGGAHLHEEVQNLKDLHRKLMRLPQVSLVDAEALAEQILEGEQVSLDPMGVDAVVWGTQE
jgi:hypothetical protein